MKFLASIEEVFEIISAYRCPAEACQCRITVDNTDTDFALESDAKFMVSYDKEVQIHKESLKVWKDILGGNLIYKNSPKKGLADKPVELEITYDDGLVWFEIIPLKGEENK